MTPAIDPSINQMLLQSLEDNKLSGFDYLKFSSSVEETKAFGVPEDARYKMAFSTAKQLGVDKANLLKSGQHYLDVLTQDERDFTQDCNEYDKKEIQAREARVSQIETMITDLAKQLTQLQNDHVTLKSELTEEKARLDSRKASFQVTLQNLRASIESNIQKINQYL
jgi:chromosome segregation ATPase